MDQRGCSKPTAEAGDVSIRAVVARVLGVQHCFAKPTAEAGEVSIHAVVARVLGVQHSFAKPTAEVGEVNIQAVVTRVLRMYQESLVHDRSKRRAWFVY
jgi:hypothetical protein